MKRKIHALIMTTMAFLMLNACGLKGALYQTPKQPIDEKTLLADNTPLKSPVFVEIKE